MTGKASPNPEVLGRILLLQSTLQAASDERRLMEMVADGIAAIPGINDCMICIEGTTTRKSSDGESPEFIVCATSGENLPVSFTCCADTCPFASGGDWHRFELSTSRREYGMLFLDVRNQAFFEPYESLAENTANLVALHIENNRCAAELSELNRNLDEQVAEETQKLQESGSRLLEAQQMAHLGHWYWDVKTGDVEWSEEVYNIFGSSPNLVGANRIFR